jgi:hypothetical protein
MKTEEQIREKYNQMLEHTELLKDRVRNPDRHSDVNINNFHDCIRNENAQHSMNALMEWILDIKK